MTATPADYQEVRHEGDFVSAWMQHDRKQESARTDQENDQLVNQQHQQQRDLGDYGYDFQDGYYETYALSWRYLGMFVDCNNNNNNNNNNRERKAQENDNNGCARKVLWAAYYDPDYSGGSIGEYQYYNHKTGRYDDTYCQTERCVPLNCHEPHQTSLELVGVYKETDGLEDFAEQLFKHEGYCLWDSNTYDIMSTYREMIPSYCRQLDNVLFANDDQQQQQQQQQAMYMDLRPTVGGDIGLGLYSDNQCTVVAQDVSVEDYIIQYYKVHEGDEEKGQVIADAWAKVLKRWNHHMGVYKVCQPCRAYDLSQSAGNEYGDLYYNDYQRQRRLENDGGGDDEQWGYNCYDDAGYTNCNQCYKFQSKTDLESATEADLIAATEQGSILEIIVNGVKYGGGPPPLIPRWATITMISLAGSLGFLGLCWMLWRYYGSISQRIFGPGNGLISSFKQHLTVESDSDGTVTHEDEFEMAEEDERSTKLAYQMFVRSSSINSGLATISPKTEDERSIKGVDKTNLVDKGSFVVVYKQ